MYLFPVNTGLSHAAVVVLLDRVGGSTSRKSVSHRSARLQRHLANLPSCPVRRSEKVDRNWLWVDHYKVVMWYVAANLAAPVARTTQVVALFEEIFLSARLL